MPIRIVYKTHMCIVYVMQRLLMAYLIGHLHTLSYFDNWNCVSSPYYGKSSSCIKLFRNMFTIILVTNK